MSGPGSYPPGDVNVSGKRDSADALLVLKYDVGLTLGVTTWPPGPGTVYLPLCDVTQDGKCNSTDALRILMCDVGLASCPRAPRRRRSRRERQPRLRIRPTSARSRRWMPATGQVVVRVLAESPYTPLAVAAARPALRSSPVDGGRLRGEPGRPAGPGGVQPGVCRAVRSATPASPPAASSRRRRCWSCGCGRSMPQSLQQLAGGSPAIEIAEATLFDLEGNALRPVLGSKEPATPPGAGGLPARSSWPAPAARALR